MMSIAVSCVVDQPPKFHRQVMRFIASLDAVDPTRKMARVVHHVGALPRSLQTWLHSRDVQLREVAGYGTGDAVYCNKLQQFEHLLELGVEQLIMCDADLVFLSSPECLPGSGVSAHTVDKPNPRPDALRHLLDEAGFAGEPLSACARFQPDGVTHRFNCNGGLYALDHENLRLLAPAWKRWAAYCLSRDDILGAQLKHADQLGFMLAMLETGLSLTPLPEHANFPTHFPANVYADVPAMISSLHYHGNVLDDGRLGTVGHPIIDRWIGQANRILHDHDRAAPMTPKEWKDTAC